MIQKVHGIDLHKRSATISVMNREGKEIKFIGSCSDLNNYIQNAELPLEHKYADNKLFSIPAFLRAIELHQCFTVYLPFP